MKPRHITLILLSIATIMYTIFIGNPNYIQLALGFNALYNGLVTHYRLKQLEPFDFINTRLLVDDSGHNKRKIVVQGYKDYQNYVFQSKICIIAYYSGFALSLISFLIAY